MNRYLKHRAIVVLVLLVGTALDLRDLLHNLPGV